jgi:hypothetical protein
LASVRCTHGTRVLSPKEEVEKLMNSGLPFEATGEIQRIAPYAGSRQPPSLDLVDLLQQGFRKGADIGEYKATAIFVPTRLQPPNETGKTDAVEVMLEHREGYCVNAFFPYSRDHGGTVSYGKLFAAPRDGVVFATCGRQGK